MNKAEIEGLRKNILLKIDKLTPILHHFLEVCFAFEVGNEKKLFGEKKLSEGGNKMEAIRPISEKIKQFELAGLKEGSKVVSDTKIFPLFCKAEGIRKFLLKKIMKRKKEFWDFHSKAYVFNFGLMRVVDTISRFQEPARTNYEDFIGQTIDINGRKLVIPGFTRTGLKFIENEIKAFYKINDIFYDLRYGEIFDVKNNNGGILISLENIEINKRIVDDNTIHPFVFKKIEDYVETFFPCSKTITKRTDYFLYGVIFSKDIVFLFLSPFKYVDALLVPYLLNEDERERFNICLFFIKRMLEHLEGKEIDYTPFVRWDKEDYIQKTIPSDAKCVSNISGMRLFISREAKTFIQVVSEEKPHIRITFFPFYFFERARYCEDPILELKGETNV